MNENKCPYCHETADECESVKLLFIDEKFKKSTYYYVAQAWIWLDRLHFEVIVPMLDYHIPRFEFFKNIKINYCPMCGRKLIVAERRKTKMKEKYLTKQDLVNELKKRDREGKKFALRFEVSMLQNKINRLQETLENNKSYLDFIDSLKLMVNVDDQKIPVNHKTVCFYEENQSLIEARMQILQRQLTAKKQELDEL